MSSEYDLAKALIKRFGKHSAALGWYQAECVNLSPLSFSIRDGNLLFINGTNLTLSADAEVMDWAVGDLAAAALAGASLLVIDRIGQQAPVWEYAHCEAISPLTFTTERGRYQNSTLAMTSLASNRDWEVNDRAVGMLSRGVFLVIDKG